MKKFAIFGLLFIAVSLYAFAMHWREYVPAGQQAPVGTVLHESSELDLSFLHLEKYEVKLRKEGNAETEWHALVLFPKGYVPPQGGEGPPVISIARYDNTADLSLEQWVRTDARSNWQLAVQDGGLGSVSVGGVPGLAYRHSGLYETDAVAVAHRGAVYLFSAGWMTPEDTIRGEFEALLSSVRFLK